MIDYVFRVAKKWNHVIVLEKIPLINIAWVLTNELIRGKERET